MGKSPNKPSNDHLSLVKGPETKETPSIIKAITNWFREQWEKIKNPNAPQASKPELEPFATTIPMEHDHDCIPEMPDHPMEHDHDCIPEMPEYFMGEPMIMSSKPHMAGENITFHIGTSEKVCYVKFTFPSQEIVLITKETADTYEYRFPTMSPCNGSIKIELYSEEDPNNPLDSRITDKIEIQNNPNAEENY